MLNKFFSKYFCKIIIFSCIFILILLQFNSKSIISENYSDNIDDNSDDNIDDNIDEGLKLGVDSHLCFNTLNQLHEIKNCFPENKRILENKPFGLESCSDIPVELTTNYPKRSKSDDLFKFYKDTLIPWTKEQDREIYYTDDDGDIKCDNYKEALKYIK